MALLSIFQNLFETGYVWNVLYPFPFGNFVLELLYPRGRAVLRSRIPKVP